MTQQDARCVVEEIISLISGKWRKSRNIEHVISFLFGCHSQNMCSGGVSDIDSSNSELQTILSYEKCVDYSISALAANARLRPRGAGPGS